MAKRPEIMKSDEAKQIIRNYNRMAQVLLEYEVFLYKLYNILIKNKIFLLKLSLFIIVLGVNQSK